MCRIPDIFLALLSRFLFTAHGFVMVGCVVLLTREPCYWLLLIGVALLGVEMFVTIKCTRNAEWKWFSPMIFLYLSTVIPSIWFLELNLMQSKGDDAEGCLDLKPEDCVAGLQQTMIIVLVLGRWLMPKGDMSRDQLSQLLMVYVGLGADILEIFDTFRELEEEKKSAVIIVGLSLFSWALMQFPLVLTQTNSPKLDSKGNPKPSRLLSCFYTSCCSSEIWSLLLTVGLQDGPFLVYRLYLMLKVKVLNQMMIFFTCKNILIVMLDLYRIIVVLFELHGPGGRERSPDDPQSLEVEELKVK